MCGVTAHKATTPAVTFALGGALVRRVHPDGRADREGVVMGGYHMLGAWRQIQRGREAYARSMPDPSPRRRPGIAARLTNGGRDASRAVTIAQA